MDRWCAITADSRRRGDALRHGEEAAQAPQLLLHGAPEVHHEMRSSHCVVLRLRVCLRVTDHASCPVEPLRTRRHAIWPMQGDLCHQSDFAFII
jgi:hypothetical protein